MEQTKIDRINELARKKKTEGLTGAEKLEQERLREEYIEGYRPAFAIILKDLKSLMKRAMILRLQS